MKKWMYVIFPTIALVVFFFFYEASRNRIMADEQHKAEIVAQQKADEAARKAAIEAKARADAVQRAKDRDEADRAAAAEHEARYQKQLGGLIADKDSADAEAERKAERVKAMQAELDALRADKVRLTRETFDLEKQIEDENVRRRDAEIEIQRMVEMISEHADASSMAKQPPPAAPATAGSNG